jgi:hypothetical protein
MTDRTLPQSALSCVTITIEAWEDPPMQSQHYRRPWVIRDTRVPNVIVPPRQLRAYSPPELPAWRDSLRAFAIAGMDSWPQLLILAFGLFFYFTLRIR